MDNKILDFTKKIKRPKVNSIGWLNDSFTSKEKEALTIYEEDKKKFKAEHIKDDDERIIISTNINGTDIIIKVYKKSKLNPKNIKYDSPEWIPYHLCHNEISFSMNGKAGLSLSNWFDINEAIKEAVEILL
jgi:hypothetical protein